MKKFFLPILAIALIFGCSSDDSGDNINPEIEADDDGGDNTGVGVFKISEIDAVNDMVTIVNAGDGTLEIGDYFLCRGPRTYMQISGVADDTSLEPNETVSVAYTMNQEADGVSIFSVNDFESSDPNVLVDYVQWGTGGQARVEQAVAAGRWDDVDNVAPGVNVFTFNGGADDFGSTFWTGEEVTAGSGIIRVLSVDGENNEVTLTNLGESPIEIGDYFLCRGVNTYVRVGAVTTGDTNLEVNETITLPYNVDPTVDGLSIFSVGGNFSSSDPSILVDYVQWGAGGQARVAQAVAAGRWDDVNNVAPGANVFTFNGDVDSVGSTFWSGEEDAAAPGIVRILSVDGANDEVTLTNLGESPIEIGDYFLCRGVNTYVRVGTVATGDTNLDVNETITLSYNVDPDEDGLSIFSVNSFSSSDPEVLVDYVQWGASGQARVGQAVTAGRWGSTTNFVPSSTTYDYNGGATDVGVTFW